MCLFRYVSDISGYFEVLYHPKTVLRHVSTNIYFTDLMGFIRRFSRHLFSRKTDNLIIYNRETIKIKHYFSHQGYRVLSGRSRKEYKKSSGIIIFVIILIIFKTVNSKNPPFMKYIFAEWSLTYNLGNKIILFS